ncbi:lysozyme [Nitrospirillum iridis]|uniref:Lysozyme n=1 Tax=Nitrospirillum iridis TaxID=765888 RepID=A0A7X0AWL3_9PROT|nr:lysozyme [Nitrospirillum iridis]MBB6251449.1 lysozyme [Nitrospirillum iridis]
MIRRINSAGLALLRAFESCELEAYRDVAGIWTIGWGHTGRDVVPGLEINQQRADALLLGDLDPVERRLSTLRAPLNDNQFGAFAVFLFNVGLGALNGEGMSAALSSPDWEVAVPVQMLRWNKATVKGQKVVVPGLARRREAEVAMWQTPCVPAAA